MQTIQLVDTIIKKTEATKSMNTTVLIVLQGFCLIRKLPRPNNKKSSLKYWFIRNDVVSLRLEFET